MRMIFDSFNPFEEESSASSLGTMLDMLEFFGKNFLLPHWVRCLICLKY